LRYFKCEVYAGVNYSVASDLFIATTCVVGEVSVGEHYGGGFDLQGKVLEVVPIAVQSKAEPIVFAGIGGGLGYAGLLFWRRRKGDLFSTKGQVEELPPPEDGGYGTTVDMTDGRQKNVYQGMRG
jgi:hypothetical protein